MRLVQPPPHSAAITAATNSSPAAVHNALLQHHSNQRGSARSPVPGATTGATAVGSSSFSSSLMHSALMRGRTNSVVATTSNSPLAGGRTRALLAPLG
jgi:putative protein kinase ArgK-like GTPase of G3E family